MDIMKLITEQMSNPETLGKLGKSVGMKPTQVQQVAEIGLPTLLKALGRNAETSDGAASLAAALEQHQDDEVEDINGFIDNVNSDDGSKILQHVFGGKNDSIQAKIAKQTGFETSQVSGIMTQLAPLMMGALGQQKKQQNLDASGIAGLLGSLGGQGNAGGLMGMVTNLLDADDDGNIVDDVGGILEGILKK